MLNNYFRMEKEDYKGKDIFIYCFENNDYIKADNLTNMPNGSNFDIDNYMSKGADLVKFITIPQVKATSVNSNNNSVSIKIQLDPVIRYIEHNLYTTNSGYYIYEFIYELDGTHDRIYILIETPKELQNDYIFFHLLRVNAMEMIRQSPLYTNNRNINNKNINNEN